MTRVTRLSIVVAIAVLTILSWWHLARLSREMAAMNADAESMAAMGMPPGRYHLGEREVVVDGMASRLADGTLAGSILTIDQAVRNMVELAGCTPAQALTMAAHTPARLLGLNMQGQLQVGYDADIAVFDRSLRVTHTFVRGQLAFEAQPMPDAQP